MRLGVIYVFEKIIKSKYICIVIFYLLVILSYSCLLIKFIFIPFRSNEKWLLFRTSGQVYSGVYSGVNSGVYSGVRC